MSPPSDPMTAPRDPIEAPATDPMAEYEAAQGAADRPPVSGEPSGPHPRRRQNRLHALRSKWGDCYWKPGDGASAPEWADDPCEALEPDLIEYENDVRADFVALIKRAPSPPVSGEPNTVWDDVLKFVRWSANVREDTIENIGVARELLARIEAEARVTPPALPLQAIEWAQELVRQGYRDEHIVTFTDDGYGLEHPIRCRPNLTGCILNEWLRTQMAPDREPGRYVMEWAEDGPKYTEAER